MSNKRPYGVSKTNFRWWSHIDKPYIDNIDNVFLIRTPY